MFGPRLRESFQVQIIPEFAWQVPDLPSAPLQTKKKNQKMDAALLILATVRDHHGDDKPYKCLFPGCEKGFNREKQLTYHGESRLSLKTVVPRCQASQ